MLETVWQDLRHGTRMLVKNPGFSLVAILSIAIGVGANAAMFSVADGLILRPLPVPDANELVTVSATTPTGEVRSNAISYPDYADLRDRARSFEGLAATRGVSASIALRRDESARGTYGLAVSSTFFDVPTKIASLAAMRSWSSHTRPGRNSSMPIRTSSVVRSA
jgi:macrolide transport system ATP-binding/permease protein